MNTKYIFEYSRLFLDSSHSLHRLCHQEDHPAPGPSLYKYCPEPCVFSPFLSFMGSLAPWFDIRIAPTLSNRISILDNPYVMCTPTDKKCLHFLYGLCITELTTDTAVKLKLLSCVLQYEYHSFHWWRIGRMLWMEITSVPVTVKIFPSSISSTVWIKRFITTYEMIVLFIV